MRPHVVVAAAASLIVATAFPASWSTASPPQTPATPGRPSDSLKIRVVGGDNITLTLRDPHGRVAYCAWDSTHAAIPGCRAFSMVEIYDAMGEDGVDEPADSADAAMPDTNRAELSEAGKPAATAADSTSERSGTLRFVVPAPQSGEWLLEARVPAGAGFLASTLWLDVQIAPSRGAAHVAFGKWAELKPGGRVWTRLRLGQDGSVRLIRTMTRGTFVWRHPATRR